MLDTTSDIATVAKDCVVLCRAPFCLVQLVDSKLSDYEQHSRSTHTEARLSLVKESRYVYMNTITTCICIYIYMNLSQYIYIYRERETERPRETETEGEYLCHRV